MIHHDTDVYQDVQAADEPVILGYEQQQLTDIHLAAEASARKQIEWLHANNAMFDKNEVFNNQYAGFMDRLGKLAVQRSAQ